MLVMSRTLFKKWSVLWSHLRMQVQANNTITFTTNQHITVADSEELNKSSIINVFTGLSFFFGFALFMDRLLFQTEFAFTFIIQIRLRITRMPPDDSLFI